MPRPRVQRYESRAVKRQGGIKDSMLSKWQDRRDQARMDRRRYEGTWHLCQSYLAGRQWVAWSPRERRILSLAEQDEWKHRERHVVNVLTPHVWNMISRVMAEDLRPEVTFRREDVENDLFLAQAKAMWEYAWDEEVKAEESLLSVLLKEFCYGTAAARCFFDPSLGPMLGELPLDDEGRPITDLRQAAQYVAEKAQYGEKVTFKNVREGRNVWEPLSPFNLLPPPGIERETDFPWLIVERPVSLERLKQMFPGSAADIEAQDLSAVDTMGLRDSTPVSDDPYAANVGRLEDHALVATGYELPCPDYPEGYTYVWTEDVKLAERNSLPYTLDGVAHHGIVFFHYHKVEGRFWAQGLIEKGMGVQRQINRHRSQNIEMVDRNLGRVYAYRGTITEANEPIGKINELIEITPGHEFPKETQGVPPGPWIQAEAEISQMDLDRVLGMSDISQGMAPSGVTAYAALSLLSEQAERSIVPIITGVRRGVRELGKLTIHNVRLFWPTSKKIAVVGDENKMQTIIFEASQLPESVYLVYPAGPPAPHSPAAEVQKIFDLYDRSVAGGRPLPISWLAQSLKVSKAAEIPEIPGEAQQHKAELENMLIARGSQVFVRPYDEDLLHVEVHRAAQSAQDLIPGNEQLVMLYEQHIQQHVFSYQQKMMMAAQTGAFQGMMASAPGASGPAGLPPPFAGAEQTASQRGPLTEAGTPNIAGG